MARESSSFCVAAILTFFLAAGASAAAPAAAAQPGGEITRRTTPEGVEYGLWPAAPARPAPTLILLAGTIDGTLSRAHFRKAGNLLADAGYLCVSIDLPCHGSQQPEGEPSGLKGWRARAAAGDDFVAEFNRRMSLVLDHLIATGLTDPQRVAVAGTSRGGFLAIRFAAHDRRVGCVAAHSPVTDLRQLREFDGTETISSIDPMNLDAHIDALVGRPVFIVIGDRDTRVGTDAAITFARRLSAAAAGANVPSNVSLHVLSEPRGHTSVPGDDALSARWIHRALDTEELPTR